MAATRAPTTSRADDAQPSAASSAPSARFAFATLVTTDGYLPGAVVLANSLRHVHTLSGNPAGTLTPSDLANLGPAGLSRRAQHVEGADDAKRVDLICFVTPATVSIKTIRVLLRHFDRVVGVEPLSFTSLAAAHLNISREDVSRAISSEGRLSAQRLLRETRQKLRLLGRPDLGDKTGAPLTKLHAWRLTGYEKVIFMDADMVALRPLAHLFSISAPLAASPDIGWPDSFNTGLLVLTPSLETFGEMREYAVTKGSWDGADQGLLNDFFGGEIGSPEAGPGGGWQRLPFRYNVTPNAGYTFAPAYQRYGSGIMSAHFIGQSKPWQQSRPHGRSSSTTAPADFDSLMESWYAHLDHCYPGIEKTLNAGQAEVVYSERGVEVVEKVAPMQMHEAIWILDMEETEKRPGRTLKGRPQDTLSFRGAGSVDDLKGMFRPDIVAASATAELEALSLRNPAEQRLLDGVYLTLPLDGRTSLMPLLFEDSDEEAEDSGSRSSTPRAEDHVQLSMQHEKDDSGVWSPPKLSWDPAKEAPPAGSGQNEYQMRNPVETHFSNAWDMPAASQAKGKRAFFEPEKQPAPSREKTLSRLQREHFFDNLGSDQPDVRKVKAVFPWESSSKQQAPRPSRIFPDEEPPNVVPGTRDHSLSLQSASGHAPERRFSDSGDSSNETRGQVTGGKPSALESGTDSSITRAGLPPQLSYTNAWDMYDSIRKRVKPASNRSKVSGTSSGQNTSSSHASATSGETSSASQSGKTSRSSQTSAPRYRNRGAQAEMTFRPMASRRPQEASATGMDTPADQSGDGDNESSSSSDEDLPDAHGTARRREGPGPGYQRKAENFQQSAGNSPRSPRSAAQALPSTSPMPQGAAFGSHAGGIAPSESGYAQSLTSDSRSRTTSYASEQYLSATSTPARNRQQPGSGLGFHTAPNSMYDVFYDANDAALALTPPKSGSRKMRRGGSGGSARGSNSGASGSSSAAATPVNLSPSQSRADLQQLTRLDAPSTSSNVPVRRSGQGRRPA